MDVILLLVEEFVGIIAGVTIFCVLFGFWAGKGWGRPSPQIERIKNEN